MLYWEAFPGFALIVNFKQIFIYLNQNSYKSIYMRLETEAKQFSQNVFSFLWLIWIRDSTPDQSDTYCYQLTLKTEVCFNLNLKKLMTNFKFFFRIFNLGYTFSRRYEFSLVNNLVSFKLFNNHLIQTWLTTNLKINWNKSPSEAYLKSSYKPEGYQH